MLVNVSAVSLRTWREVFAVNVEAALTASQQAAVRQMSRPVLPADDPKIPKIRKKNT